MTSGILTVENNLTLYVTNVGTSYTENDTRALTQRHPSDDWEGGWKYNLRVYNLTRTSSQSGSIFSSFTLTFIIDPHRDVRSYQDLKRVNIGICDIYDQDNWLNSTKI